MKPGVLSGALNVILPLKKNEKIDPSKKLQILEIIVFIPAISANMK